MIDPIQIISDAETTLRKIQHSLRSEISRRLLIDVESLLGSIAMLEVDMRQKDQEAARIPASYKHD